MRHDIRHRATLALAGTLAWVVADTSTGVHAAGPGGFTAASVVLSAASAADAPPAEAMRYHRLLQRRPSPGYLFDRFVRAWLAESTPDALEAFLREQADGDSVVDDLLLAFRLGNEGRHVEAIQIFRTALDRSPGSPAVLFEKARAEAATLDFDTALSDLEVAAASLANGGPVTGVTDVAELSARVDKLRGRLLARTGDREAALRVWDGLLAAAPDDTALHEDLIRLQTEEGEFDAALATLDRLMAATADARERLTQRLWRADVLRDAGRDDDAIEAYVAMLDDVGRGSWLELEILAQLETVHRRVGDLDVFEARLDELIEADATRHVLLRRKATLAAERGDTKRSLEAWRELLARSPQDLDLRQAYAERLAEADRRDDAIAQFESLVEALPDVSEIAFRLATLLHQAERTDDAASMIEVFLERSGDEPSAWIRAAGALIEFDRPESAIDVADRLLAADAQDRARRAARANILLDAGAREDGLAAWRSLADDADAVELVAIARTLAARGERADGRDALLARVESMRDEPAVLAALVDSAIGSEDDIQLLPWAERWVAIAATPAETLRAINATARLLRRLGETDRFEARLAAKSNPTVPERCLLAEIRERADDPIGADAVLEPLLRSDGSDIDTDPRPRLQMVRLLEMRFAWSAAADMLAPLAERPGAGNAAVYRRLIRQAQRAGEPQRSLEWARRWRTITPDAVSAWRAEADALVRLGRGSEAIGVLERASRRFDDVVVRDQLARTYERSGQRERAESVLWALFEEQESLEGQLRWARRLAESARRSPRQRPLVRMFEGRRDEARSDVRPHLVLAQVHDALGDWRSRRDSLIAASRVAPDDVDVLLALAAAESSRRQFGAARRTLERAARIDPSGRARLRLIDLELETGDALSAVRRLTASGATMPPIESTLELADRLFAQREFEAAANLVRARSVDAADDVRLVYQLAVLESMRPGREAVAIDAFLDVLDAQTEIPATVVGTPSADALRAIVPAESRGFVEVREFHVAALSHRTSRSIDPYRNARSRNRIVIPLRLDDARAMAVSNLIAIGQALEPDDRDALVGALEGRGIVDASLLMSPEITPRDPGALDTLLARFPDHPSVRAAAGIRAGRDLSFAFAVGTEQLESIATTFADRAPTVALMSRKALVDLAVAEDPDAVPMRVAAMLDQAARIGRPGWTELKTLSGLLVTGGVGLATDVNVDWLDPAMRSRIERGLVDWYRATDLNPDQRVTAIARVAAALARIDAYDSIAALAIEFLDVHAADIPPSPSTARSARDTTYTPLGIPPQQVRSIPSGLLDALGIRPSWRAAAPTDTAKVLAALNRVDGPPLLRAVLAIDQGEVELASALIDPLLESESADAEVILIAGAWAADRGSHAEALELLVRASYLPMSADDRARLDRAILASAMQLAGPGAPDGLTDVARRSGLRVLRRATTAVGRLAIVDSLAQLGLEEDADRLRDRIEARLTPEQAARATASILLVGGGVDTGGAEGIEDAVRAGRRDEAARLAAIEMSQIAQRGIDGLEFDDSVWEWTNALEVIDVLARYDLVDRTIEIGNPPAGTPAAMIRRYAEACLALDRPAAALERAESALAERPDVTLALLAGRIAVEQLDGARAGRLLATVPPRRMGDALETWSNPLLRVRQDERPKRAPVRDATAEALITYMESIETPSEVFADLARVVIPNFSEAESDSDADDALPHLDDVEAPVPASRAADDARRRDLHDRLARSLIRVPSSAAYAFERLLASHARTDRSLDGFEALAVTAILASEHPERRMAGTSRRSRTPFRRLQQEPSSHWRRIPVLVEPRGPMTFLAMHVARTGDRSFVDEALTELRSRNREAEAARLETMVALYGSDEDAMSEAARSLLDPDPRRARGRGYPMRHPIDVLTMWARVDGRALDRTQDAVIARWTDPTVLDRTNSNVDVPTESSQWTGTLLEAGRGDLAESLLVAVAVACLGPESSWRTDTATDGGSPEPAGSTEASRWILDRTLDSVASEPRGVGLAMRLAIRAGRRVGQSPEYGVGTDPAQWVSPGYYLSPDVPADRDRMLRRIDRLSILDDLDTFSVVVLPDWRSSASPHMFGSLTSRLAWAINGSLPSSREGIEDRERTLVWRRAMRDRILASPERTLGESLFIVATDTPAAAPADWWRALEPWADRLIEGDEGARARVLAAIPESVRDRGVADLPPEVRPLAESMLRGLIDSRSAAVSDARAIDAEDLRDPRARTRHLGTVMRAFDELVDTGRLDEAIELVESTCALVEGRPDEIEAFAKSVSSQLARKLADIERSKRLHLVTELIRRNVAGASRTWFVEASHAGRSFFWASSRPRQIAPDIPALEGLTTIDLRRALAFRKLAEISDPAQAEALTLVLGMGIGDVFVASTEDDDSPLAAALRTPGVLPEWFLEVLHDASALATSRVPDRRAARPAATANRDARVRRILDRQAPIADAATPVDPMRGLLYWNQLVSLAGPAIRPVDVTRALAAATEAMQEHSDDVWAYDVAPIMRAWRDLGETLPAEVTDPFLDACLRQVAVYRTGLSRGLTRPSYTPFGDGFVDMHPPGFTELLVDRSIASGRPRDVLRIISGSRGAGLNPVLWRMMLRGGMVREVAAVASANWEEAFPVSFGLETYDVRTHASLESLRAEIADADVGWFVTAMVMMTDRDPPGRSVESLWTRPKSKSAADARLTPGPDHASRFTDLARAVLAHEFTRPAIEARILALLATEPAVDAMIRDRLATIAADVRLLGSSGIDGDESSWAADLAVANATVALRGGDPAPAIDLYRELDTPAGSNPDDWDTRPRYASLDASILRTMRAALQSGDQQGLEDAARIFRVEASLLLAMDDSSRMQNNSLHRALVLSMAAPDRDAHTAWIDGLRAGDTVTADSGDNSTASAASAASAWPISIGGVQFRPLWADTSVDRLVAAGRPSGLDRELIERLLGAPPIADLPPGSNSFVLESLGARAIADYGIPIAERIGGVAGWLELGRLATVMEVHNRLESARAESPEQRADLEELAEALARTAEEAWARATIVAGEDPVDRLLLADSIAQSDRDADVARAIEILSTIESDRTGIAELIGAQIRRLEPAPFVAPRGATP